MPTRIAAGERDPQLLGRADRRQALLRVLGRRALVGDEVRVDRLQHEALRGGHLAQAGEILAAEHAEVGVRQQAALERSLARPHDVAREVLEPERVEALADAGMVVGRLAREHQQLLGAVAAGAVEDPLDLVRLVEVRAVRGERAVLAVAAARPGERQRQVAREGDAAAPSRGTIPGVRRLLALVLMTLAAAGCGGSSGEGSADEGAVLLLDFTPNAVHSGIYVARARDYDLGGGRRAADPQARRLDRRAEAAPVRPRRLRDPRHPRPRAGAPERRGPRRRDGDRPAPAGRRARAAGREAPARPGGPPRRRHRPAVGRRRAALGGGRRRRRSRPRARDHDRLPGGAGDAGAARGRGDGVLERRGRGAEAAAARRPGVPRRRLRRARLPRAGAVRDARHARGPPAADPLDGPRAPARLRRGADRPGERRDRRAWTPSAAWTARS